MASTPTPNHEIPLVASITRFILAGNKLYVPEPPLQEEKILIWKSQVLIPFTISDIMHAFSGPFPDLNMNVAKTSEFLPCYRCTKPLVAVDQPLDFTYMSTRVFCFAPYTNQSNYLNWVNKVEFKK